MLHYRVAAIALAIACLSSTAVGHEGTMAAQARAALDGMTREDGPGAVVLIAKGDRIVYQGVRGRANIELDVPLKSDDTFRIASITKMFTAAMILKLSEGGQLKLDDLLATYFPDFPDAHRITLRMLLSHTSGVSDRVVDPQPGFSRRDVDTATLVAEIRKRPLDFAPGTRWSYSNAGFVLLGAVIEKVTGKTWYDAIRAELLQPVGLTHTAFGAAASIVPGRVAGYSTNGDAVANASYISLSTAAAAGGLLSTAYDLLRWMRALSHGQVISSENFRQMIAVGPELPGAHSGAGYGLGMYIWHVRDKLMVGHTGEINGFCTAVAYLPDIDVTVVILANDDSFDARTVARRLAAIALGEPYSEAPAREISIQDMQALAGIYRVAADIDETLSVKGGNLYARRGNGNAVPLRMTTDGQLHLVPDEITYFVPVRDGAGRIIGLNDFENGDAPARFLPRVP